MLLNSQAVKGLPVICGANGKKLGIVSDVQYTPGRKKIDGIVVQDQRRLSGSNYIPMDKIITFGEAAVIVKDDCFKTRSDKGSAAPVIGRTVMRADGYELGTISDIVFDSAGGWIVGYEISKGFIDDLLDGRSLLYENTLSYIGDDVFVVSVEQSEDIQSNHGGLRNIFSNGYLKD